MRPARHGAPVDLLVFHGILYLRSVNPPGAWVICDTDDDLPSSSNPFSDPNAPRRNTVPMAGRGQKSTGAGAGSASRVTKPPASNKRPPRYSPAGKGTTRRYSSLSTASSNFSVADSGEATSRTSRSDVGFWFASQHPKRRPWGLNNPRFWCYRRAMMQCLCHVPAFVNWLHDHEQSHRAQRVDACLTCAFSGLATALWTGPAPRPEHGGLKAPVAAVDRAIANLATGPLDPDWCTNHDEADSHEALTWVLGHMDPNPDGGPVLRPMFRLVTSTAWRCQECQQLSTTEQAPEIGISLGIQERQSDSINDHLDHFFSQEVEGITCPRAECGVQATRRRTATIVEAPRVLIIQLQRFSWAFNRATGQYAARKVDKSVEYGHTLDLSPYAADPEAREQGSLKYRLASVVMHAGDIKDGHYIAVAKGPAGTTEISDGSVRPVGDKTMLQHRGSRWSPYLLFYVAV